MAPTSGILYVTMQPKETLAAVHFHDWYNNEHGPGRLRLPFIPNGFRYRATDLKAQHGVGSKEMPEWMAIYDIDDMNMLLQPIYTRLRDKDGLQSQRERDVMAQIHVDRRFYDYVMGQESPEFKKLEEVEAEGEKNVLVAVSSRLPPGKTGEELDRWYDEEHIPALSKVPGWLRTRIFKNSAIEPKDVVEYLAVHEYKPQNGLGGPEFLAATGTEWSKKIASSVVAQKGRRAYELYYTFGPASRDLAALSGIQGPPFSFKDGLTTTYPGASPVIESYVTTEDGVDLPYRLEGSTDPTAPLLIFSNSILTDWTIWDGFLKSFLAVPANQKYRILRYNQRGRAANYGTKTIDINVLAADLIAVLDAVRVPQAAAVIGVSLGGATTLNVALTYPDRLAAFIACDTNATTPPGNSRAWGERITVSEQQNVTSSSGTPLIGDALAELTVRRWFSPASYDGGAGEARAQTIKAMVTANDREGFKRSVNALYEYDLAPRMRGSAVRGLFVVGAKDGVLPGVMEQMAKGLGPHGAGFVPIEGAGHLPMVERPEKFAEVVGGFLAGR